MPKWLFSALVLCKPMQYKKQKCITGLLLSYPEKCASVMFQMEARCRQGEAGESKQGQKEQSLVSTSFCHHL